MYTTSVLGVASGLLHCPTLTKTFEGVAFPWRYPVHFKSGSGQHQSWPSWVTSVDNVLHHTEFNVQIHTIQLEWPRNWLDVGNTALRKEETWGLHQTGFGATKAFRSVSQYRAPSTVLAWGDACSAWSKKPYTQFRSVPDAGTKKLRKDNHLTQVEILRIVATLNFQRLS